MNSYDPFTQAIFVAQLNAIFVTLKMQLQTARVNQLRFQCDLSPRFEIQLLKHGDFE